ncbi:MAG: hypothetical protein SVR94_12275, partial [Pseudomonadota bacterium]|nr:hypothetical protein [Pseudomonadota bacterium]
FIARFSSGELQLFALSLGIQHGDLTGATFTEQAIALIQLARRVHKQSVMQRSEIKKVYDVITYTPHAGWMERSGIQESSILDYATLYRLRPLNGSEATLAQIRSLAIKGGIFVIFNTK